MAILSQRLAGAFEATARLPTVKPRSFSMSKPDSNPAAPRKAGYKIAKYGPQDYRLHCWYNLGTGRVWDGLPSLFATRQEARAAGEARCSQTRSDQNA